MHARAFSSLVCSRNHSARELSLAYISHVSLAPTKQWEGSGKRWVVCLGAFFLMARCQCRLSSSHQTTDDLPTLSRYRVRVSSLSLHHADFFLPRHTNSFLLLPPPLLLRLNPALFHGDDCAFLSSSSFFPFLLFFPRCPSPTIGHSDRASQLFFLFSRAATFHPLERRALPPLFLAPKTSQCVFKVANCKLRFVARVHTQPPGRGSRRAA